MVECVAQSACPGPRPLSPIALQTRRIPEPETDYNLRVCSAMEGRGRDPGQRALQLLLLLLLLLLEGAAEARLAQRPREQTVRV